MRAAVLVFLLSGALIAAVAFTLDRNARQANSEQAGTELASVARVAAARLTTMRANLRIHVSEFASSARLQKAVLQQNFSEVTEIAKTNHARILVRGHTIGTVAHGTRLAASAFIANGGRRIAKVTIGVPLDDSVVDVLQVATPVPNHGALLLVANGRVLAGGPKGAKATIDDGEMKLQSVGFAARDARVGIAGISVVAVEPLAAVNARADAFRRRLLLAAALTLALAAALAARLGRPVARVLGEVARLSRQAQTDGLTRLANRRTLDERLDEEVDRARRLGTSVAFVIADVDNFKSINDRYGHQVGDDVLRAVARALAEAVRELDLAGRFGGEEFAAVLPGTNLAGARRVAERIRSAVEALEVTSREGEALRVTTSVGAACFPTHDTIESLVAAADAALYDAKRGGKNQVVTATAKKKSLNRVAAGSATSA